MRQIPKLFTCAPLPGSSKQQEEFIPSCSKTCSLPVCGLLQAPTRSPPVMCERRWKLINHCHRRRQQISRDCLKSAATRLTHSLARQLKKSIASSDGRCRRPPPKHGSSKSPAICITHPHLTLLQAAARQSVKSVGRPWLVMIETAETNHRTVNAYRSAVTGDATHRSAAIICGSIAPLEWIDPFQSVTNSHCTSANVFYLHLCRVRL